MVLNCKYTTKQTKTLFMKKLILSLSIAGLFAACSSPKSEEAVAGKPAADTSGLSAFNEWKAQQDAFNMEGIQAVQTDAISAEEVQPEPAVEQPKEKIVYRTVTVQPKKVAQPKPKAPVYTAPKPVSSGSERVATTRDDYPVSSGTSNEGVSAGAGTGVGPDVGSAGDVASVPQPAKKEGWSKAAQGTAIGGASGAVIGAIIGKNKAAGAVIGGVVGAAGGYILGRSKDKKDGRY
jgi:hypothetical protein